MTQTTLKTMKDFKTFEEYVRYMGVSIWGDSRPSKEEMEKLKQQWSDSQ